MGKQPKAPGARANTNSRRALIDFTSRLDSAGYTGVTDPKERKVMMNNYESGLPWYDGYSSPIYVTDLRSYYSIYDKQTKPDILAYDPTTGTHIIVECKSQSIGGSVDEKYPFTLMTMECMRRQIIDRSEATPHAIVYLLVDGAATPASVNWIKRAADKSYPEVRVLTSSSELHKWCSTNL